MRLAFAGRSRPVVEDGNELGLERFFLNENHCRIKSRFVSKKNSYKNNKKQNCGDAFFPDAFGTRPSFIR